MTPPLRKAMVLAAGSGKRLRPLTVHRAKPALPLLGTPMIEYVLRRLARAGVQEAVVNLHHEAKMVEAALERSPPELAIKLSVESELLGTAGGLKHASRHFEDEAAFLLVNADTLVDFDVESLARTHRETGATATLLLRSKPSGSSYSTISVDDDGRIDAVLPGSDHGELMFAGVWVLSPSALDYLSGEPAGLEKELLPRLIEQRAAFACVQETTWITIDTPGRYWAGCLTMARGQFFEEDWNVSAVPNHHPARVLAGGGTQIKRGASFRGDVVLGSDCRVARSAQIESSICWDRVVIPNGVKMSRCIIAEDVELAPDMELLDKLVMPVGDDTSGLRRREIRGDLLISQIKRERTRGL